MGNSRKILILNRNNLQMTPRFKKGPTGLQIKIYPTLKLQKQGMEIRIQINLTKRKVEKMADLINQMEWLVKYQEDMVKNLNQMVNKRETRKVNKRWQKMPILKNSKKL